MDKKVRWGILGYAGIARNHVIPAMRQVKNAEVCAIASRSRDKLTQAVERFGFPKIYESYDRLLEDPDIDAVYIPVPNALHKEWVIKAAGHGKHVLCEKPLALTEADCREMAGVCREKGVLLMEAFMYRFSDRMQVLEGLLRDGVIGEIRHIYSTHRFCLEDKSDVRVNEELGGGSLRDVGCYPVNLIGWLLEDFPVRVSAKKTVFQGVDDTLTAVLNYRNGVTAQISCGFDACSDMVTEINGTKGSLLMRDTFIGSDAPILVTAQSAGTLEYPVAACDCYARETEIFSAAVLGEHSSLLGMEETIRNNRLIEMILKEADHV